MLLSDLVNRFKLLYILSYLLCHLPLLSYIFGSTLNLTNKPQTSTWHVLSGSVPCGANTIYHSTRFIYVRQRVYAHSSYYMVHKEQNRSNMVTWIGLTWLHGYMSFTWYPLANNHVIIDNVWFVDISIVYLWANTGVDFEKGVAKDVKLHPLSTV